MYKCELCNQEFEFHRGFSDHLKFYHSVSYELYVLKTKHNNVRPLCQCGCGKETNFAPRIHDYSVTLRGHQTPEMRAEKSRIALEFYASPQGKETALKRKLSLHKWLDSEDGKEAMRLKSERYKAFFQTKEGKKSIELKSQKVADFYATHPEARQEMSVKVKAWSDSEEGRAWVASHTAHLKELYASPKGKELIDAISKKVSATLSTPERVEEASVRAINYLLQHPKKRKTTFIQGHYYSEKNKQNMYFRSSYELRVMICLDADKSVVNYQYEPVVIKYGNKRYLPDFLVSYANGTNRLIEIKAKSALKREDVKLKTEAALVYCKENNLSYSVMILKDIRCYERFLNINIDFWRSFVNA